MFESIKNYKLSVILQFLVLSLISLASFYHQEIIPFNNGFGFDAHDTYKPIILNFPDYLFNHKIDPYSIQRILPFGLVYGVIKMFRLPFSDHNIILFFQIYQFIILLLIELFWIKLATHLKLTKVGLWLGFIALIVNFATLKLDFYYPISYDRTALLIGTMSLYFYLTNNFIMLFISTILGMMVWPTTMLINGILILFPYRTNLSITKESNKIITSAIALLCLCLLSLFIWVYTKGFENKAGITPPVMWLLPLSFAGALIYLFNVLNVLAGKVDTSIDYIKNLFAQIDFKKYFALLFIFIFYLFLTKFLAASNIAPRLSLNGFLVNLTYCATSRPLQFLIGHILYFGPVVLLLMLLFIPFCKQIHKMGLGIFLIVAFGLCQSINSESRQAINLLPFFVVPFVLLLEDFIISKKLLWATALLSIFYSRLWLPINFYLPTLDAKDAESFPIVGAIQSLPAQLYFMNFAPWASNKFYLLHVFIVFVTVSILAFIIYSENKEIFHKSFLSIMQKNHLHSKEEDSE
jgi:hypothetical protein